MGPFTVVGIVTGYGLDGPGIESRWGQDFLHLSRPVLGPTQPPVQWPPFESRQDWTPSRHILESPCQYVRCHCLNTKHSFLQSTTIHFPTILCELTHYTNTHKQQPYCVGTLNQMTERLAERRVRQKTGWLAGGPLLGVATTRRTTDTFLCISHTTNVLLFKFRCNIFIGVRIIKEMPGSATSGTPCICPAGHERVKDKINFTSAPIVRARSYKLIFFCFI
jgi:hypothetical protein